MNTRRDIAGPTIASVEEEAADWFAIMRGPGAAERKADLDRWLGQGDAHRQAYERMAAVFEVGSVLAASRVCGARVTSSPAPGKAARVPLALAAGFAIVVATGLSWTVIERWTEPDLAPPWRLLSTPRGAMRTIHIARGATVTLDSASRIEVEAGQRARRLRLIEGRARFAVSGQAAPLTIKAGSSEISSNDGVFDLTLHQGRDVSARLYSGAAEARPIVHNAAYVVRGNALRPGQLVRVSRGVLTPGSVRFIADDRAWPSGWAEYRAIPLGELAAITSRYGRTRVVVTDPRVRSLTISGRLRFADSRAVAANLARVFDLRVVDRSDGLHLEMP